MKTAHEEIIDVELDDVDAGLEPGRATAISPVKDLRSKTKDQRSPITYLFLPAIFLIVTLLGGLRLGATDNAFLFLRPALVCLVFASVLMTLFFRSGLIGVEGWFSERLSTLQTAANAMVMLTMFTASTQIFNSLLPEKGLPFWVVGFCFMWTLWNNLFADFETKKLLRSLGALFGMAFVIKYLVLANMTAAGDMNLLQRIFENPAKEAFTWLLDLPRYAAGTGYIQFFALALFLIGLFLTPRTTIK